MCHLISVVSSFISGVVRNIKSSILVIAVLFASSFAVVAQAQDADFSDPFGGTTHETGSIYTYPTVNDQGDTTELWAGFGNTNSALYPIVLTVDGSISFTASVPSGGDVDLRFKLERLAHNAEGNGEADTLPSFFTDTVTVSGSTPTSYTIAVPAQVGNTYRSFLLYLLTKDESVVITDIDLTSTLVPGCTNSGAANYDAAALHDDGSCVFTQAQDADFSDPFGGTTHETGSIYTYPTVNDQGDTTELWAGFGNTNSALYPIVLTVDGSISFTASVPSGGDVDLRFKLERLAHNAEGNGEADTLPSFFTDTVTVSGSTPTSYTIAVPAQVGNTYRSFLLYLLTKDESVVITDIKLTANAPVPGCTNPDATNYDAAALNDDGSCVVASFNPVSTVPTDAADSVLSIFSNAYIDLAGTNFGPPWGQATTVTVADDVLTYTGLDYQGTVFGAQDVSGYGYINIDFYTSNATHLEFTIIGDGEHLVNISNSIVLDQWVTVQIPLTDFTGVNLANVSQMKFDTTQRGADVVATVVLDNIYFGGIAPAPTPTEASDEVLSLFSDAFADVAADFNTNWGTNSGAVVSDVIAYANLGFQGTQLSAAQDVSSYEYFNVDVYANADVTELEIFLIKSGGGGEQAYNLVSDLVTGKWVSVEIPLTAFSNVDLTGVDQLKLVGKGTVLLDNLYFAGTVVDTDGDGVVDTNDAFPDDASETLDSDSDGTGDNADAFPNDASETLDSDSDGTGDNADYAPNDANVQYAPATTYCAKPITHFNIDHFIPYANLTVENSGADSIKVTVESTSGNDIDFLVINTIDAGGTAGAVVENGSVWSSDITWPAGTMPARVSFNILWSDTDNVEHMLNAGTADDGLGLIDTSYICPPDADGDGVADADDAFPNDASESADSDNDGVGDNADYAPNDSSIQNAPVITHVDVTFAVDMTQVDTNAGGVSIAGGEIFGEAGQLMDDADGDDIWTLTTSLPVNTQVLYKFRNQPNSGWTNLDDGALLAEEGCAIGQFNDRYVDVGVVDLDVPVVAFSSCFPIVDRSIQLTGVFGGTSHVEGVYTVPAAAESWGGFSNENTDAYPITLAQDSQITFNASVPSGGDAVVRFRFEANPHPATEPSFNTDSVTVSGATEASYTVLVPSQGANTFNSFLMYVDTRDEAVAVSNVVIAKEPKIELTSAFGGTLYDVASSLYTYPSGEQPWAGFGNTDATIYPLTLANDSIITFKGSVPSGADVDVRFRFEANAHPNTEPSFDTDVVTVSGATVADYFVKVPSQGANTFNSFLMYLNTNDVGVVVTDVAVAELNLSVWDFDGNGDVDALTDGLLLLRYAFELRDARLVNDSLRGQGHIMNDAEIQDRIEAVLSIADIDGNGSVDPLSDALLMLRYMFEVQGAELVDGVVDLDCGIRTSHADVTAYIEDPASIDPEPNACALQLILAGAEDATNVSLVGPAWDQGAIDAGPVASKNNDGTWSVVYDPAPEENVEYLWAVDGEVEDLFTIYYSYGDCMNDGLNTDDATFANRVWVVGSDTKVVSTFQKCSDTPDGITFTATMPDDTTSARVTSEVLDWNLEHFEGVATDNGDGTWTASIRTPMVAGAHYKWVANNEMEDIKDDYNADWCTDEEMESNGQDYANRLYDGSTAVTGDIFGKCSGTPEGDVSVNLTVSGLPEETNNVQLQSIEFGWYANHPDGVATDNGDGSWTVNLIKPWPVDTEYKWSINVAGEDPNFTFTFEDVKDDVDNGFCANDNLNSWDSGANRQYSGSGDTAVVWGECSDTEVIPHVNATFQVDMTAESVDATGVYLAGGNAGNAGYLMTETDAANNIWSVTISVPADNKYTYKFRNRASTAGDDWGGFEEQDNLEAMGCGDGQYFDRFVDVGSVDLTVPVVAFGSCTDQPYVAPVSEAIAMTGVFGGSTILNGVYTFPSGVETWAGFGNENESLKPFTIANDSVIEFNASVPDDGTVELKFKFEYQAHPNVEPSYTTEVVSVSGSTEAEYSVNVPSQGANTFESFLMYVITQDKGVAVSDIVIRELDKYAQMTGTFANTTVTDGVYKFPSSADSWAGFANTNNDVYPITVANESKITFTASVPNDGTADLHFKLEANPHPNNTPYFTTDSVTVSGSTEASYTILVPSQGVQTFNSFLMYLETNDIDVSVKDILLEELDSYVRFTEAFGNATITDGVYSFPVGAESWAGFANMNSDITPITLGKDALITFNAYAPNNDDVDIRFQFEANSHPANIPNFQTSVVTVSGDVSQSYSVAVPAFSDANQTFNSLLMYIDELSDQVVVTDVIITEVAGIPTSPTPSEPQGEVISLFSGVYTDLVGTSFDPNWGQNTNMSVDDVITYNNFAFQGTDFAATDVSGSGYLNIDVYTTDATSLEVYVINAPGSEVAVDVSNQIVLDQWVSIEVPLSAYSGVVDLTGANQLKIVGNGTVLLDNIYFAGVADPTEDPTTVLSIFGTTYGNLAGANFDPAWGQGTDAVAGDVYVLNNLDYQGVALNTSKDVTGYDYLHLDYYTDDSTVLNVYLISTGPVETPVALDLSNLGQWNSIDIPLTSFTATDLADVIQMKFDGNGTIRVDNMYFGSE